MPSEAFAGALALIREAVGADRAELTRRVPKLDISAGSPRPSVG